jgi:hypothetical protein
LHLVVLSCRINFYTMIETNDRPTLRLVRGEAAASDPRADELDECVVSRAAVRAGDRHEPWTLPAGSAMQALAAQAADAGVELELAVRLCVEAALAHADLRAAGIGAAGSDAHPAGGGLAQLDALAAAASVTTRVDACDCAYLRRLTRRGAHERRTLGDAVIVGLPARLSGRLLDADLDALLANADVGSALAWEIAAVLDGRTISEWAPLTALRALASGVPGAA